MDYSIKLRIFFKKINEEYDDLIDSLMLKSDSFDFFEFDFEESQIFIYSGIDFIDYNNIKSILYSLSNIDNIKINLLFYKGKKLLYETSNLNSKKGIYENIIKKILLNNNNDKYLVNNIMEYLNMNDLIDFTY